MNELKVYIASWFADKDRVKDRCIELNALGIGTTSRWASESVPHNCTIQEVPEQYLQETAVADIEDIDASDVLVLTVPTIEEMSNLTSAQLSRGGRNFESGYMYGLARSSNKELIVLGRKENIFHFLSGTGIASKYPAVKVYETWDEVKGHLIMLNNIKRRILTVN